MDGLPQRIELTRVADGATVLANLVKLTRRLAHEQLDSKWWLLPGVSKTERRKENDHSWNWAKRLGELRNDQWHEAVAVQTDDGQIQGAILYRTDAKSFVAEDQGAVYVEALATAPRNRPWLVESPLYRGVGEGLLLRAITHSYLLGLEGRTNLVAFDDDRTIKFYTNRSFALVGYDDELPMFELTPEAAKIWLLEEGFEL
jgi:hypothetical protein